VRLCSERNGPVWAIAGAVDVLVLAIPVVFAPIPWKRGPNQVDLSRKERRP
jgi:hypothetical protein